MRLALVMLVALTACSKRSEPNDKPVPPARVCEAGKKVCNGDTVVQCTTAGAFGESLERCQGVCKSGACVDTCALQDVELVYVIDHDRRLLSFDPKKLPGDPFHLVGTLACGTDSSPNSMAIDRRGIAWVAYHSGRVYRASIVDAHCAGTGVIPSHSPRVFGMGFVTDGGGATTEKLFVAGGFDKKPRTLATLDDGAAMWRPIGTVDEGDENPELTGTGDGRIYAYFSSPGRGFVQELDRTTGGRIGERWVLPGSPKNVEAYAFAHWGGVFYVFTTADGVSSVHAIHKETGVIELVEDKLPMVIVGAGVSTCAPLLEAVP